MLVSEHQKDQLGLDASEDAAIPRPIVSSKIDILIWREGERNLTLETSPKSKASHGSPLSAITNKRARADGLVPVFTDNANTTFP